MFNSFANSENSAVDVIAKRAQRLRYGQTEAEAIGRAQAKEIVSKTIPASGYEMDRDWWRVGGDTEKFEYLRRIGSKRFKKIVKMSLPFDLVTDILRVMDQFYEYKLVKLIGKIFIGISKSSDISMFQLVLTDKDKAVILSLFNKLKVGIAKMEESQAGTVLEASAKKKTSLSYEELEIAKGKFNI